MKNPLCLFLILFMLAGGAFAQTDLSTIRGTVSDPSGSAVPAAAITLTNIETNIALEAVTTSDGDYEIPYLTPGKYRLTATGSGFKTFVADNILITSRQTRRIDVTF